LNTLTGDIQTIHPFIALAVTQLLAAFALCVNKAVTAAVSEVRNRQSDLLATLQEGLQSIEVIKAFEGEDRQEQQLQKVSTEMVTAWLQARRVSALMSPSVTLAVAVCTGLVLWRGSLLVLSGANTLPTFRPAMTIGSLSVFLAYLARFFQPARDLAQMTNTIATVSVGFQRVTAVCDADTVIPERPAPRDPAPFRGEITFENVSFAYDPAFRCCATSPLTSSPARWWGSSGPPAVANQTRRASSRASGIATGAHID
jgi:subfamily B ATP-binding cassette protein MsbA